MLNSQYQKAKIPGYKHRPNNAGYSIRFSLCGSHGTACTIQSDVHRILRRPYHRNTAATATQRRVPRAHPHPQHPPYAKEACPRRIHSMHCARTPPPSYKYLGFRLHEREEDRLANTGLTHHGTRTLRILIASQQHNQTVNTQANTTHRGCTVLQGT